MKIGILGIGGVGGFIGAPLAKTYQNDPDTEIIFICRGNTQKSIQEKGLIFESQSVKETVHPDLVSDNPAKIGVLDVLFITTKSYSLDSVLLNYQDCIGDATVIIPLQNMVNAKEVIRQQIPQKGKIVEGCIYVASNVIEEGYVKHVGGPGKIFIGGAPQGEYEEIITKLQKGGLDLSFEENILPILWKKYLFVAPVAAVTTAYQLTFGALLEDKKLLHVLEMMMREVKELGVKKDVDLKQEDVAMAMNLLTKFPYSAKSSLQVDFEKRSTSTEKFFLVDYVIESCAKEGLSAHYYE